MGGNPPLRRRQRPRKRNGANFNPKPGLVAFDREETVQGDNKNIPADGPAPFSGRRTHALKSLDVVVVHGQ